MWPAWCRWQWVSSRSACRDSCRAAGDVSFRRRFDAAEQALLLPAGPFLAAEQVPCKQHGHGWAKTRVRSVMPLRPVRRFMWKCVQGGSCMLRSFRTLQLRGLQELSTVIPGFFSAPKTKHVDIEAWVCVKVRWSSTSFFWMFRCWLLPWGFSSGFRGHLPKHQVPEAEAAMPPWPWGHLIYQEVLEKAFSSGPGWEAKAILL